MGSRRWTDSKSVSLLVSETDDEVKAANDLSELVQKFGSVKNWLRLPINWLIFSIILVDLLPDLLFWLFHSKNRCRGLVHIF